MKLFGVKIPFLMMVAIIGFCVALLFSLTVGNPPPPPANHLSTPPANPYEDTVAGTGIVEANSRNIALGVFVSGIVQTIPVTEGDFVKAGDVVLQLDQRTAAAELTIAEEELHNAEAALSVNKAAYADENTQLARLMKLPAGGAVSVEQQQRQLYANKRAKAQMDQAEAMVGSAKARVTNAQVLLDKHSIRAPIDGQILKLNVQPGEFVSAMQEGEVPVLMGNTNPLHIRVQLDENDLWRFKENAEATALLRSNQEWQYDLRFIRIEPYVLPKRNLSGDARELVDTRIMEVIYAVEPKADQPLYVGQQLDVYIKANAIQNVDTEESEEE